MKNPFQALNTTANGRYSSITSLLTVRVVYSAFDPWGTKRKLSESSKN